MLKVSFGPKRLIQREFAEPEDLSLAARRGEGALGHTCGYRRDGCLQRLTSVWSFGQTVEDFVDEAITRSSRDDTDEVALMSCHSRLAIAYSLILQLHLLYDLLSM